MTYFRVQWCIDAQRWRHIHFKQPRLQLIIDQYIVAIQLETVVATWHKHATRRGHRLRASQDRFDNNVLDVGHQLLDVAALLAQMPQQSAERPLVPNILLLFVGLDIVRMVFVDAVVAQMHASVPQVLDVLVVLDRCQANQTLFVHVHDEWVVRGDHHIQADVALVAVDAQRIGDVARHQAVLVLWDLLGLWWRHKDKLQV